MAELDGEAFATESAVIDDDDLDTGVGGAESGEGSAEELCTVVGGHGHRQQGR
jgi:hypothetical protein